MRSCLKKIAMILLDQNDLTSFINFITEVLSMAFFDKLAEPFREWSGYVGKNHISYYLGLLKILIAALILPRGAYSRCGYNYRNMFQFKIGVITST